MKVVLADDHQMFREGLRWMLADEEELEIVGEAADGAELLDLLEATDADVVLLDVRMPGTNGLDALERLRDRAPQAHVVILSMYGEPGYVRRAFELGASGYLLKSTSRQELLKALRSVADGRPYVQAELAGPFVEDVTKRAPLPGSRLSAREREVLQLVADGLENKQIARELGVSEATVKTHLKAAFSSLGVESRAEAVAVGLRAGLID